MWMMGYNEPHEDHINMVEAYGNRKLRPPPPTSFHPTHHQHLVAAEQNKREFNSQQMVVVSSRWNPTPEQLQTLEELYRRGTRTPSADEIQHITAQLRRFGKIEGKNVFYWFQNHKARQRQKRRRQLHNNSLNNLDDPQTKHSEVEETRNWAIPTFSEKNVIREKTGHRKTTEAIAEDEEEGGGGNDQMMMLVNRRRKNIPERNATWSQMMQCLTSPCTNAHITLINSTGTTTPTTSIPTPADVDSYETLELFPVNNNREQPEKCFIPAGDVSLISPRQFIEFLPLKS